MKNTIAATVFILFLLSSSANAQTDTDNHQVTIDVNTINSITVTNDVSLTVNELDGDMTDAQIRRTGVSVATNDENTKKITVEIDESVNGSLNSELALEVSLTGISGIKNGYFDISDGTSETVADGFKNINEEGEAKYRATATPKFDPSTTETVTVKYTLIDE